MIPMDWIYDKLSKIPFGWIKNFIIILIFIAIGIFVGYKLFHKDNPVTNPTQQEQTTKVKENVSAETKTQIVYVPKETVTVHYIDANGKEVTKTELEKTDLDATIGKPDFTVKLNGNDTTFTKTSDEKYMFEKNKLAMTQTSKITIDATVEPLDKTKWWGVGVGYSTNGFAGQVNFPINKKKAVGGWIYADSDTKSGGLEVKF